MSERADAVVIGAGVVGLAVARALALSGREVIVLERAMLIGSGTSSRNSEVIHAGIYYPAGSVKARACVAGKAMLYDFCRAHGVGHARIGKLIVASEPAQLGELQAIRARAAANGVHDLVELDRAGIAEMEPALSTVGGLFSPSTGIIDSHGLMLALQGEAEDRGAMIAFGTEVTRIVATESGPDVTTADGTVLACRTLVNAAGLFAAPLAAPTAPTDWHYAKGNYYAHQGRVPFRHLVYPVPEPGGLGVHVTLDLAGQARFGPDVEWLDTRDAASIDYTVDPQRSEKFYAAVRRYWPDLKDGALLPDYAGVRPKLAGPGAPNADFTILGPADHGRPGLVHLLGIESPGLTSCLWLAARVAEIAA
ncbi:MAG: NAD(P)/FAD-dependent oxidoreductase [Pseudomonadota bacterium]|nr:NAD(P)/FAD-dependent oxidoreductase [Pseudomonadota bacterium]